MYSIIKSFPQNLQEVINQVKKTTLKNLTKPIRNIMITGMGSSGLAGTLVKQWVIDKLSIPLATNHDYHLPTYVDEHTLLIVVSYSGNTQETIQAFQMGIKHQANILVIASGGNLQKMGQEQGIDVLPLPKYLPPRACIDHTIVQVLFILYFHRLLNWEFLPEFESAIQLIRDNQAQIQAEAEQVASKIQSSLPIIYTIAPYEAVAIRLRQQLNENSKQLCWYHTLPELSHNEIVGWESNDDQNLAVIILNGYTEDHNLKRQLEITQAIIQKHTNTIITLNAQGQTHLIRSLYLIHLSDWISFYLAQKKGVDPLEVKYIDQIKTALYADN